MTDICFYSNQDPIKGELVLVEFINKNDSFFEAKLLEYNYTGMMCYNDITKKKKITSWNKLVPLNKHMVAQVEEVDENKKFVQLSIVYLKDNFKEQLTPQEVQDKLMVYFTENEIMKGFIKSLCIIHSLSYNEVWTDIIYKIDRLKKEDEECDDNISIWKYFSNNINTLSFIDDKIKELYNKKMHVINKIISRVGIISPDGIENTKKLLTDLDYSLTYDSAPYYIYENSNINMHHDFIKNIQEKAEQYNIFIKVDFVGKYL